MNMNEVNKIYRSIFLENGEEDENLSKKYKKSIRSRL